MKLKILIIVPLITALTIITIQAQAQAEILPREYFGARLEPLDKVIHGAGQTKEAFANYCQALSKNTQPEIYMCYTNLQKPDFNGLLNSLRGQFSLYPDYILPQIGLAMAHDGSPEKHFEQDVAAGQYDKQISNFREFLDSLQRPVYIRLGFEFNGFWNGYKADTYIPAFIRVEEEIRKSSCPAAIVWCYSPDGSDKDFMRFYPGDEHVDWWAIDLFAPAHFSDSSAIAFLDSARAHHKPVMIGESTPRRVGVLDGRKSWDAWFKLYFDMIHSYPQIKAFCYIDWNWAEYKQWKDWGDARIEKNKMVRDLYEHELENDLYLNAGSKEQVIKALGIR